MNLLLTFGAALAGGLLLWKARVPGGMRDIPIIAEDMGADAGKVAILQYVCMSTGIGLLMSWVCAWME